MLCSKSGDQKESSKYFMNEFSQLAGPDGVDSALHDRRNHVQREIESRTRTLFAKIGGRDIDSIISSLGQLLELARSHYFEVQEEDLMTLKRVCETKYGRRGPELVPMAHSLLSKLCGFPSVAGSLVRMNLLGFIVNEIPEEWAIGACTRIAKIGSTYRDAVIDAGALYLLEENLHLVSHGVLSYDVVCKFARVMLRYECTCESYTDLIRGFLLEILKMCDDIQSRSPQVMKLAQTIEQAKFVVKEDQTHLFLSLVEKTLQSKEADEWFVECAKYIGAVISTRESVESELLHRCWNDVLTLLSSHLFVSSICAPCGEDLVLLVRASPEVCIASGYAKALPDLVKNADFPLKCALAACMATLFRDATQTQYRTLVLDMQLDLAMLPLISSIPIDSDYFPVLVKGVLCYLQKMAILENRHDLFKDRVLSDDDLGAWVTSIDPTSTKSFAPDVIADCQSLHELLKSIRAQVP